MNKPTEQQVREFWEWCGYKGKLAGIEPVAGEEEGKLVYVSPPIDLNNLFKYAVPKLIPLDGSGQGGVEFRFYPCGTSCILTLLDEAGFNEEDYFLKDSHDPALVLFWALWQIKES